MATVGEALAATIDAQWNVGTGGTKPVPIVYLVEHPERNPNSKVADAVFVWLPLRRKFDNDIDVAEKYRNVTYTIRIECHTKTSSARQLEIENEVDRILASGTVITGATRQKVLEINDISNRLYSVGAKFVSEILIEVFTAMEESATAYGGATTAALVTDTLEFTAGGGTINRFHDEDNMASDDDDGLASQQSIKAYTDLRLLISEIDNTPVNGVTTAPISSNWAFDHEADTTTHGANGNIAGDTDVSNAITTHTSDDNAHHEVVEMHSDLSDTALTGTQLEDLLMFGSANAAYVPMALEGTNNFDHILVTAGRVHNRGVDDIFVTFTLSKETLKGVMKLHIKNLKFIVFDADANDKIDRVTIYGWAGVTRTTIDSDDTDHISAGDKTFSGAVLPGTAIDVSGYDVVYVEIACVNTNALELDFTGVRMECYYDT